LQGLSPVVVLGCLTPARSAYIIVAIVYALIALGLWKAKRWVFILAIFITLAQSVTFSSPSYVWDLALGLKFGPYITHLSHGAYCYVGAHFDASYHKPDFRMPQIYTFVHEDTFVLLNLFGIILTILLLIQFRRIGHQPSNTALEPTPVAPA
jgi:hypothetical protein